jgi:hypothetical protein
MEALVNTIVKPSGTTKGRELLDQRSDYQLLKKDSSP